MSTADELSRLAELHRRGDLSDDEYARAKQRVLDEPRAPSPDVPLVAAANRLRRSRSERWIAGVCGGLARVSGVEAWIWRLALVLLAFWGGSGVVVYLLMWIFVPQEPDPMVPVQRIGS